MKEENLIHTNKGITTKTMQSLYKIGWHVGLSGSVHTLYNKENKKVCYAFSWIGLLNEVEKLMR